MFDQPAPGIDIPFLQHDGENITRKVIASAQDNMPESSMQINHKVRVAKISPAQIWPGGPVGGLPLARRGQGPIGKIRGKRSVIKDSLGVAKSLLLMSRSGFIRNFLFSLAGPVLKKLKSEGSKSVYNSIAEYFLPFTGLQGHEVAEDVKGLLEKGEVNTALETLERHRIRFKPQNLWLNEPEPMRSSIIPSQDMNSHQVYKAARKTLPYIDNILTERLKSQSIVDTSLTQALFDDLKNSLSKDIVSANERLQGVLAKSGHMEAILGKALEGH